MHELRSLLEAYGFELARIKGSHYSFTIRVGDHEQLLVVPFRHPLHTVYVKKALALIEQIEDQLAQDEGLNDE
jgi:predicted RNA binding protein YcfA (HicA-like mRNA interferase family)